MRIHFCIKSKRRPWLILDFLKETFKGSGTYKDKAHLHTRCVRLEYAGDFQIDVVPCVVYRPGGAHQFEVCNRIDDEFEVTDGEAYTRWLEQRNTWTGLDKLREVTRLLKYLRDIKGTFSCKSILLTTLLGERIESIDEFQKCLAATPPDAGCGGPARARRWRGHHPALASAFGPQTAGPW